MKIEDIVKGRQLDPPKNRCIVVERSLDDLGDNPLLRYIRSSVPHLKLKKLKEVLGRDVSYPLSFIDAETTGVENSFSIVSLAITTVNGDIETRCVFPQNYRMEEDALRYFFRVMPHNGTVFTYNGRNFDVPKISERARQRGVQVNGTPVEIFEDCMEGRHIDLYHVTRKIFNIQKGKGNRRLQSIEKNILGYERKEDVPSSRVPEAYRQWVYYGNNPREMAGVMEHNMGDSIAALAILLKLAEGK